MTGELSQRGDNRARDNRSSAQTSGAKAQWFRLLPGWPCVTPLLAREARRLRGSPEVTIFVNCAWRRRGRIISPNKKGGIEADFLVPWPGAATQQQIRARVEF